MMHYYSWNMGRPVYSFGLGWILGALFWVLAGILIFLFIKKLINHDSNKVLDEELDDNQVESALEILKKGMPKGN